MPIYDDFNPCEGHTMSNAIHASIHVSDTTGQDDDMPSYGVLYTLEDFVNDVINGSITSDDGFGEFFNSGKLITNFELDDKQLVIPEDTTHVLWFNK